MCGVEGKKSGEHDLLRSRRLFHVSAVSCGGTRVIRRGINIAKTKTGP